MVVKTEFERVETPVIVKLDAALIADCAPLFAYRGQRVTVGDALERLKAVEVALALCRNQLAAIRDAQGK